MNLVNLKAKKIISLFASIICTIPIYLLLHEGGHALIAILCGARITEFSILGAYMLYEGGIFPSITLSLFHAAGMLLPVLAAIIYMLTYQDKIACIFYRIFSFIFSLITVAPILAWVIVPIFYLADKAPQSDDVTKLIDSSGLSPWAVLLGAIVLFCGCFFLAWKKKVIQNYWAAVKLEGS